MAAFLCAVVTARGLVFLSKHCTCLCVGVHSSAKLILFCSLLQHHFFQCLLSCYVFLFLCVCGICAVAVVKEGHYNPALHLNHEQIYTCCAQLSTSTCKTSCCNVLLKDICILHPCYVLCLRSFYARQPMYCRHCHFMYRVLFAQCCGDAFVWHFLLQYFVFLPYLVSAWAVVSCEYSFSTFTVSSAFLLELLLVTLLHAGFSDIL